MSGDFEHVQVVWDRGSAGTAQAPCGCNITVGPSGGWTPEQLVVAAVESSLMTVFLRLADEAGVGVLGYVSAAEATFDADVPARTSVVVRPCIVVGHDEGLEPARRLLAMATEASPVVRALGDAVRIDAEVVVVAPDEAS